MKASKLGLEDSLSELKLALEANGIYHASRYPYFYNAPYDSGYTDDGQTCTDNLAVKNWQTGGSNTYTGVFKYGRWSCAYDYPQTPGTDSGEANMGAAFNYTLLSHEPGAYTHNTLYTKRLIFDSIDALDNGVLDGAIAVGEPANTYLNNGVRP